jgi:hypothetical protein
LDYLWLDALARLAFKRSLCFLYDQMCWDAFGVWFCIAVLELLEVTELIIAIYKV